MVRFLFVIRLDKLEAMWYNRIDWLFPKIKERENNTQYAQQIKTN